MVRPRLDALAGTLLFPGDRGRHHGARPPGAGGGSKRGGLGLRHARMAIRVPPGREVRQPDRPAERRGRGGQAHRRLQPDPRGSARAARRGFPGRRAVRPAPAKPGPAAFRSASAHWEAGGRAGPAAELHRAARPPGQPARHAAGRPAQAGGGDRRRGPGGVAGHGRHRQERAGLRAGSPARDPPRPPSSAASPSARSRTGSCG